MPLECPCFIFNNFHLFIVHVLKLKKIRTNIFRLKYSKYFKVFFAHYKGLDTYVKQMKEYMDVIVAAGEALHGLQMKVVKQRNVASAIEKTRDLQVHKIRTEIIAKRQDLARFDFQIWNEIGKKLMSSCGQIAPAKSIVAEAEAIRARAAGRSPRGQVAGCATERSLRRWQLGLIEYLLYDIFLSSLGVFDISREVLADNFRVAL